MATGETHPWQSNHPPAEVSSSHPDVERMKGKIGGALAQIKKGGDDAPSATGSPPGTAGSPSRGSSSPGSRALTPAAAPGEKRADRGGSYATPETRASSPGGKSGGGGGGNDDEMGKGTRYVPHRLSFLRIACDLHDPLILGTID